MDLQASVSKAAKYPSEIVKNRGLDKFVFGHGLEKESGPLARPSASLWLRP